MEKINALSNAEFIEGCNKKWLKWAKQVLQWNSINPCVFAAAIRELLQKRRNQKINMFLLGLPTVAKVCNPFLATP